VLSAITFWALSQIILKFANAPVTASTAAYKSSLHQRYGQLIGFNAHSFNNLLSINSWVGGISCKSNVEICGFLSP
jgi:hypothetical protein